MDDIKKWQEEFQAYISELNLPRDDFKGIMEYIEEVPAQLGTNLAWVGMDVGDMINRQDAIDELHGKDPSQIWDTADVEVWLNSLPSAQPEQPPEIQDILDYLDTVLHPIVSPEHWDVYAELHDMISSLPTARPEPLTDKEQRIFLTAMAREEKVCRQVDDEYRNRTPYEANLVHVCKEIRRKVKGALWTK